MSGYWYWAYGLKVYSEVPLPVPTTEPGLADVEIRLGAVEAGPSNVRQAKTLLRVTPDEVICFWEPAGRFAIRQGRQIFVDPKPGVGELTLAAWVQGAAMSLLLHQKGFLLLHSSGAGIGGAAVLFLGAVGWGKSTTAATMHSRGHELLTDDIAAIRLDEQGRPWAMPALPHLKLMPQAAEFLGADPAGLSGIEGEEEKRLQILEDRFSRQPLPVGAVYILAEGDNCRIEPLEPRQALFEVMSHAFVATFTEFLQLSQTSASHFRNCTQLVNSVTVSRLVRPKSFDLLPKVAEMIERHVADLVSGGN